MPDQDLPAPIQDREVLLQQDAHQYDIAKLNIEATLQNQREIRQHLAGERRTGFIVMMTIIVLFSAFCFCALYLGKETLLEGLIKLLIGFVGGGGVGYAMGIKKR